MSWLFWAIPLATFALAWGLESLAAWWTASRQRPPPCHSDTPP